LVARLIALFGSAALFAGPASAGSVNNAVYWSNSSGSVPSSYYQEVRRIFVAPAYAYDPYYQVPAYYDPPLAYGPPVAYVPPVDYAPPLPVAYEYAPPPAAYYCPAPGVAVAAPDVGIAIGY
jgi:hypothetical protein